MYEINREKVVTSFESEYMFLVELVKLLALHGMCNKSSSLKYIVQAATGELSGWLRPGEILTTQDRDLQALQALDASGTLKEFPQP